MLHFQFLRYHFNDVFLHKLCHILHKALVHIVEMEQLQHVKITDFLIVYPLSQHPGQAGSLQIGVDDQYLFLIPIFLRYLPHQGNQRQRSPYAAFIGMEYCDWPSG